MAGVRVPSTSTAPAGAVEGWGRKAVTSAARRGGCAASSIRCSSSVGAAAGGLPEEHYRTLRLRPGATRGEVKKAFRRLTLMVRALPSSPIFIVCFIKKKSLSAFNPDSFLCV
jgi:hypothetical protein